MRNIGLARKLLLKYPDMLGLDAFKYFDRNKFKKGQKIIVIRECGHEVPFGEICTIENGIDKLYNDYNSYCVDYHPKGKLFGNCLFIHDGIPFIGDLNQLEIL